MFQTIDPIYTKAITEEEWAFMQKEAKYNLPNHISKAYFGKNHHSNIVSPKLYRRICLIIAFSIFLVVKAVNKLRSSLEKKEEEAAEETPAVPTETELLTEIRDLLKKNEK